MASAAGATTIGALREGAARDYLPRRPDDLSALTEAAEGCRACELWRSGTQTVFGEGRTSAQLLLVGEQPGDFEDREGRPFVGPAGRLLDHVLVEAGIDREQAYVTNAVKHFKWVARGKRRLHQKPNQAEIEACGPWLAAELEAVRPRVLVCLGATAAQALLGRAFRVSTRRGEIMEGGDLAPYVMATVHPSAVLRARSDDERREGRRTLVEEFRRLAPLLEAA